MLGLFITQGFAQTESIIPRQLQKMESPTSLRSVIINLDSLMLDSVITAYQINQSVPGIASLIIKDGRIVWNKNYGYRDLQLQLPVGDSTLFLMASISKTILATAIMQLWGNGKIDLGGDINDYLPHGFRVANPFYPADKITVNMLMTHTSSLNDNWNVLGRIWTCGDSPIRLDTFLVNYFAPGGSYYGYTSFSNYHPGGTSNYSNAGSCLLALMVEHITGQPFDAYVRDSIFTPLSMARSSYSLAGVDMKDIATPYMYRPPVPFCHTGFPYWPIGQLRTNKLELANFLSVYLNDGLFGSNRVLESSAISMMLSDQMGFTGPDGEKQGLIWYTDPSTFDDVWGHTGGWMGATTYMFCNRQEKWGIIFFINWATIDFSTNTFEYTTGDPIPEMERYAHLYGNIYSQRPSVKSPYARRNADSVVFQTAFSNVNRHAFAGRVIWSGSSGTDMDSLDLHDDGLHGDGGSHDGIYAAHIPPLSIEGFFSLSVSTVDGQTNKYFRTSDICRFTTAGPVFWAGDTTNARPEWARTINLRMKIGNNGINAVTPAIGGVIRSLDTAASIMSGNPFSVGDITPGQVRLSSQITIAFSRWVAGTKDIRFEIMFSSDVIPFWRDTVTIHVVDPQSVVGEGQELPTEFALGQNYPNPFNPKTGIRYQVSGVSDVKLAVYDILGREVAMLVNEKKEAGRYEATWDARGCASGVYICRMIAGAYVASRKMILTK
jgi:CubicO group peptidase (beta-lactamase class C family)